MNDVAATLGQPTLQAGAGNPASGFGASLQEARKRAGLTVEEVALRLRLHPKQLVALEAEQLDVLPATPFVSGFVRNCAREFGVEPGPLLDDLNAKLAARGLLGPTLDLRGPDASRMPVLDERRWRQLVMTVIIGVLVCAGLIGAWMARNHGPGSRLAGHQLPKLPAAPAAAPQPAPADAPMPASQPAGMPASMPASPVPGVGTAAEAVQAAPNPAPTGSAPAAAPNAPAGAARTGAGESTTAPTGAARPGTTGLVLRFNDRSWVEVTQPDGRVLMSHTGEPGSLELLNSAVPMQLVVGRADAVEVEYRGQPVNLKPYVNGNGVARLTLADGRISGGGSNSK